MTPEDDQTAGRLVPLIEAVVGALVRRDWSRLISEGWIALGREVGFERVLDEYGAAFDLRPVLSDHGRIYRFGADEGQWRIEQDLWSGDQGWTDLQAVIFIDERGDVPRAELYDLLVP